MGSEGSLERRGGSRESGKEKREERKDVMVKRETREEENRKWGGERGVIGR